MEIIIELPKDINKLCRTCMNFVDTENGHNYIIFNNELTELQQMLKSVTSLEVLIEDGLPVSMCSACVETLTTAFAFKNQCESTDANFRKLLAVNKSESIEDMIKKIEEQNSEEIKFNCKTCSEDFDSYYKLSMHGIFHNKNKSLTDRLNESLNCKIEESVLENDSDIEINKNLLKQRKCSDLKSHQDRPLKPKTKINLETKTLVNNSTSFTVKIAKDEQKKLICSLCEKLFFNQSLLSLHFLKHALTSESIINANVESEFFFCELCGQTFKNDLDLTEHYKEHEYTPSWACECCNTLFEKEQALLRHMALTHPKEITGVNSSDNFSCILCHQCFTSKPDLLKHSLDHLMKNYSCKKCTKSFCTRDSYYAHLRSHPGNRYSCDACGKNLSTKTALKAHLIGVHANELRFTCATCGKRFTTENRLKTHSLIHSNTKKHVCSYCGYSTHKIGDLRSHIRTHTCERPYKCTFANCTMSFKTSSHLCSHVRRHLQIRNYKCSICSIGFSTGHSLKIHQMQHTGEKPHSCLVCNRKFRRKYHVKIHMKQHNNFVLV